jgi:hypothetical protein
VAQSGNASRDQFIEYIGTVLRHLEARYAGDKWDASMFVITDVLLVLLFATGLFR